MDQAHERMHFLAVLAPVKSNFINFGLGRVDLDEERTQIKDYFDPIINQ